MLSSVVGTWLTTINGAKEIEMTVIVRAARFGRSKQALQAGLDTMPGLVWFEDPSIVNPRIFTGEQVAIGERFPVVMDPATRRRFADVTRLPDGSFKVR
jgi:hypothetical protein